MTKENWRFYQNYIIIAILSFCSVVILPMFGTSLGIGFTLPNTAAGWIVYIVTKLAIIAINILIFDQFMRQAKVNVRDDERFITAETILLNIDNTEEEILPTTTLLSKMYRNKVISTVIMTILGVFGITQAILTFDYIQMLSYAFTIIMGLIFGWVSMNQAEEIWTIDHYKWALKVQREQQERIDAAAREALSNTSTIETNELPGDKEISSSDKVENITNGEQLI